MRYRGYKSLSHKSFCDLENEVNLIIGWLVVLGLTAFETVFQSISGRLPKRERKRRERIDEISWVQEFVTLILL